MTKPILNPIKSLQTTLTCSSKDWTTTKYDAWVYGILVGWDWVTLEKLARKFGWGKEESSRLRYLRDKFSTIEKDYANIKHDSMFEQGAIVEYKGEMYVVEWHLGEKSVLVKLDDFLKGLNVDGFYEDIRVPTNELLYKGRVTL